MAKRLWSVEKKGYHYPKSPDTLREDELPKAKRCRPGDGMQSPRGSRCFNKHGKMANGGLVAKKPCDYPKRLCSFPSASRKPKSPAPRRRKSAAPVSKRAASPPSARKTPEKYKPQSGFDKQSININVNVPPSKAQGKKTIHNHYYYYLPGYPPPGQGNGGYPPPETGGYPPKGPDNLYKDYDFDLSDDFISDNDNDSDDDSDIDIVLPPPFPNGPMPYLGTGHRHRPYVPGPHGPQFPPGPLGLGPGRRRVQKLPDWFLQLILMLIGLFLKNFLTPSVPSPAGAHPGSSPAGASPSSSPAGAHPGSSPAVAMDIAVPTTAPPPLPFQTNGPRTETETRLLDIVSLMVDKFPLSSQQHQPSQMDEAKIVGSIIDKIPEIIAATRPEAPGFPEAIVTALTNNTASLALISQRLAPQVAPPAAEKLDRITSSLDSLPDRFANIHFGQVHAPIEPIISALNNNTAAMNSFVNRPPVPNTTPAVAENTVALAAIKALRKNTKDITAFIGRPPAPDDSSRAVAAMDSTADAINRLPAAIAEIVTESRVAKASDDLRDIRDSLDNTNRVIEAQLTESNATVRQLIEKMSGPQDNSDTVREILASLAPIIRPDREEARSANFQQNIDSERAAIVSEISSMFEKITSAIASQQTPLVDLVKELVPQARRDVENSERRLAEAVQEGNRRVETAIESGDRRLKDEVSAEKVRFELLIGQNDKAIELSREAMEGYGRNGDAIREALDKVERLATAMGGTVERLFGQTLAALPAMMAERDSKNDQLLKSITESIGRMTQENNASATEASRRLQTMADAVSEQVETTTNAMTTVFSSQLAEIVKKIEDGSQREQMQLQQTSSRDAEALRNNIEALAQERESHIEDIRTDSDRLAATIKEVLESESREREKNLERFTAIFLSHDQSLKGIVDANNQFLENTRARAAEELQKTLADRDRTNKEFVETLRSVMEKASTENTKSLQGATIKIQNAAKESVDRADRDIAAMRGDFQERMNAFERERSARENFFQLESGRLNEQLERAHAADVASLRENIEQMKAQYRSEREARDVWHRAETERHGAEISSILGREAAEREESARTLQAVLASNGENLKKVLDSQKSFFDAAQASVAAALRDRDRSNELFFDRLATTMRENNSEVREEVNHIATEAKDAAERTDRFIEKMRNDFFERIHRMETEDQEREGFAREQILKLQANLQTATEQESGSLRKILSDVLAANASERAAGEEARQKDREQFSRNIKNILEGEAAERESNAEKLKALLRENNETQGRSFQRLLETYRDSVTQVLIERDRKNDTFIGEMMQLLSQIRQQGPQQDLTSSSERLEKEKKIAKKAEEIVTKAQASINEIKNEIYQMAGDVSTQLEKIAKNGQEVERHSQERARSLETHLAHVEEKNRAFEKAGIDRDALRENIANERQRSAEKMKAEMEILIKDFKKSLSKKNEKEQKSWKKAVKKLKKKIAGLSVQTGRIEMAPQLKNSTKHLGTLAESLVHYSDSVDILESLETLIAPDPASSTSQIASISQEIGQYDQSMAILNDLQTITPPATSSQTAGLAETSRAIGQYSQSGEIVNALQTITPPATSSQTVGLAETSQAIVLYGQSMAILNALQTITPPATSSQTAGLAETSRAIVLYGQSGEIENALQTITPPATSSQTVGLAETSRAIGQYDQSMEILNDLQSISPPATSSQTVWLAETSRAIGQYDQSMEILNDLQSISPPATSSQTAGLAETSRAIVLYGQSTVIVNDLQTITPPATSSQTAWLVETSRAIVLYGQSREIVNALQTITPPATSSQTAGLVETSRAIGQYSQSGEIVNALQTITPPATSSQTVGLAETSQAIVQYKEIIAIIGLLNEINAPVPMSSTGQLAAISMEIERYKELKTTVSALTHINPPATSSQTAGLAETSRAIVQYGQSTVIVNALQAITPLAAASQTAGLAETSQAIVQYNDTNAIVNALWAITPPATSSQTAGLVETSRALAQLSYITAQNYDLAQLENKEQERRSEEAKAAEDRLAEEFSGVRDLTEAGRSRRSLRNLVGKQAVKMQDNLVNEFSGVSELASAVASRNAIKVIPKRIAKKRQFSLIGEFESLSELTDAKELRKQTENIEKSLYKKKRENGHANLVEKMNESLYENFRREVKADIVITVSPALRRKILEKHPISANGEQENEVGPNAKVIAARRSERTKGVKVNYKGMSTDIKIGKKRSLSKVYAKSPTPEMKRKKPVKTQIPINVTNENADNPKIIAAVQEVERRINLLKRIKDEENQSKNEEQEVNAIEPKKPKNKI